MLRFKSVKLIYCIDINIGIYCIIINIYLFAFSAPNIKHIVPDVQSPALDSDYSVPPSSPTKYNRRIKAVPRLGQRKTSFSASESEDESRRHGRIRNNSVRQ